MNAVQKRVLVPYEQYIRSIKHDDDVPQMHVDSIVASLPESLAYKSRLLLKFILGDATDRLRWNDKGELKYDGNVIEGSSITELLKDSQRERRKTPRGADLFYRGLKDINAPRYLITNRRRKDDLPHPPGIPDTDKTLKKKWIHL